MLEGFEREGNDSHVFISLKFIQYNYQCFSDWTKVQMNEFWNFNRTLHKMTWQQVYKTGGNENKTGLAYTPILIEKYPKSDFTDSLSNDITIFELRLSEESRVHGFRYKAIFYLCWLDRGHDICK